MTGTRKLKRDIEKRIRDFDVSALLALLAEIAPRDRPFAVRRAGHPARAPRLGWLEAISFGAPDEPLAATVTANLGLSSCRGALPDYFRQLAADPDVNEALGEFLALIDDRLIERRFASYRPEDDPSVFPDWPGTSRDLLCLGEPRSPAALHWLFHKVYPELRVSVRRTTQAHAMPAPDARLGAAKLSVAALGGRAVVPVGGIEVVLASRERAHWAESAPERLHALVFPALRGAGAHLTVWLLVLDDEARARIFDGSLSEPSHLGYDPILPAGADASPPARVLLFAGSVPDEGAPARLER